MAMHPSGIEFGVMDVLHNLRVQSHSFFVNKYLNFIQGCEMLWSFFGNGHGNDQKVLQREYLDAHGAKLQNIEEVDFLSKHLLNRSKASYTSVKRPLQHVF
jgi:hypothetical protein